MSVTGYSGIDNPEFQKHLEAVKFCIKNKLSFPKETSEFFKGKVGGDDLEDISEDSILAYIENGIEVNIPNEETYHGDEIKIKVSDIPKHVDLIVAKLS